jgi:FkbM family methyltransferase
VFTPKLRWSIFLGKYEINELRSAAQVIRAGDTVLELGSGCGFLSCALAKSKKLELIHCVEANPEMIPVIPHHHQINGVKGLIHNEIIGGSDGEIDFFVRDDFWASSTAERGGRKVTVKATGLADRLTEWRPDVVIMDIEGGELALVDCDLPPCVPCSRHRASWVSDRQQRCGEDLRSPAHWRIAAFSLLLLTTPALATDLGGSIYREGEDYVERPAPPVVVEKRVIERPVVIERRIIERPAPSSSKNTWSNGRSSSRGGLSNIVTVAEVDAMAHARSMSRSGARVASL